MRDIKVTQNSGVVPQSALGNSPDRAYLLVVDSLQILVREFQFVAIRVSDRDRVAVWILWVVNRLLSVND